MRLSETYDMLSIITEPTFGAFGTYLLVFRFFDIRITYTRIGTGNGILKYRDNSSVFRYTDPSPLCSFSGFRLVYTVNCFTNKVGSPVT